MQAKFIKKFALSQNFRIFGCCGEIRSAPFATTFARITSASCAAASRTSHNKRICKILKSRTSSDLELHKSARTLAERLHNNANRQTSLEIIGS